MENYVDMDRICEMLGVTRQTVYAWIEKRGLPSFQVKDGKGSPIKFKESAVREWLESFGN